MLEFRQLLCDYPAGEVEGPFNAFLTVGLLPSADPTGWHVERKLGKNRSRDANIFESLVVP